MINSLQGKVVAIHDQSVVLDINGIGFELFLPDVTKVQYNQTIALHTHLHWNQENGPSLFGFITPEEKTIFILVTKCPGIGPKLALAILHHCPINTFLKAIQTNDITTLHDIPGIGRKKAEQLVVELKDKVAKLIEQGFSVEQDLAHWKELTQVLNSLNYSKTEIANALDFIKMEPMQQATFDQLLRKSLSYLAKRR